MAEERGWREIPIGGLILEAGNAERYVTGGWRTYRPQVDKDVCIDCLQCWLLCPDMCINVEDGRMTGYDYAHCKGCGICERICPVHAIRMILESEAPGGADEGGCWRSGKKRAPKKGAGGGGRTA
ncbi:MAG: 4Fe-4S binding protein [bacterium]|nr:4Fe-4S binding protein [bacterium]